MQPIKEQLYIALQAIAKLLWMVCKEICLLMLALIRYVYANRVEIMQHKATLPLLILLSVVWSGYKSRQYFAGLDTHTEIAQPVVNSESPADKPAPELIETIDAPTSDPQLIKAVEGWLGTPHRDGQRSKKGTDCSGFVREVFKEVHQIELSASSAEIFRKDIEVIKKEELQEGDLVFFNTFGSGISHVGIYLADGKFAHTSTSRGVTIDNLDSPYYRRNYRGSGRVVWNE